MLKFQNKLYSVTLVCRYLIHVLTQTKWDLELWKIYKAPFLWLCTVSLSLFCTVRGDISHFHSNLESTFCVCMSIESTWELLHFKLLLIRFGEVLRSSGDTEDGRFFGYIIGTASGMHLIHFAYGSTSYRLLSTLDRQEYFACCHERRNLLFWHFNTFSPQFREPVHTQQGNFNMESLYIHFLLTLGQSERIACHWERWHLVILPSHHLSHWSQECVHAYEQGNLFIKALCTRSRSTPGST